MDATTKVFGIGMTKTGTSSLSEALTMLGIPSIHSSSRLKPLVAGNRQRGGKILAGIDNKFQGFCDYPIPHIFEDLDRDYPGCVFIRTVRDIEPWIRSRLAHFGNNEAFHRDAWEKHQAYLEWYFKDRLAQILHIDICGGEGWAKLCPYLGEPVPDLPFPHKNKTTARKIRKWAKRYASRWKKT